MHNLKEIAYFLGIVHSYILEGNLSEAGAQLDFVKASDEKLANSTVGNEKFCGSIDMDGGVE